MAVNLFPYQEPTAQPWIVDVDPAQETFQLPQGILEARTSKAAYALSKPYDDVLDAFNSGKENQLREQVSGELTLQKQLDLRDVIFKISKAKQGPLTTDELNYVTNVVHKSNEYVNPQSVLERAFANKHHDSLYLSETNWLNNWRREQPEEAEQVFSAGKSFTTKQQILIKARDDAKAKSEAQSFGQDVIDRSKNLFTLGLYGEFKPRTQVPGSKIFGSGILLGTNLEDQRRNLWGLSDDEFARVVPEMIDNIAKDNPLYAAEFAQHMLGTDVDMENFFSGLTFATAPGVGTLAKLLLKGSRTVVKGTKELAQAKKAVEDMAVAASSTEPPKVAAAVGAGNLGEAAVARTTAEVAHSLAGTGNPIQEAIKSLPRAWKEEAVDLASNPGRGPGSQELTNRLIQKAVDKTTNIVNIISNFQRVSRIAPIIATENGVRVLKDSIKKDYRGTSSRVVDIKGEGPFGGPTREPASNVHYWELQIGRHDGTLFTSPEEAAAVAALERPAITLKGQAQAARQLQLVKLIARTEQELKYARAAASPSPETAALLGLTEDTKGKFAGSLKIKGFETDLKTLEKRYVDYQKELDGLKALPGATIEQQGAHFYISMFNSVEETSPTVRKAILTHPKSHPDRSFASGITDVFRRIRTPEETEAKFMREQAKVAIFGANNLLDMAKAELEPVTRLARFTAPGTARKQRWEDFKSLVKTNRDDGETFTSVGQVQDYYLRHHSRMADDIEVEAYFAWKSYGELKGVLEDLKLYKEEMRIGAGNYSLRVLDKNEAINSPVFKARSLPELPSGKEDGILIMGSNVGEERIYTTATLGTKKQALVESIRQGKLKVLEVLYPNDNPLKGFAGIKDHYVKYVVTENSEVQPLSLTRVDRKGNGLWDLEYPYYGKQEKLVYDPASKTWRYKGDNTMMPFANGTLGEKVLKIVNEVRERLAAKDEAGALKINQDKGSPIPWETLRGMFMETVGPDGRRLKPQYDVNSPIRLVPGNKLTIDFDNVLIDRFKASGKLRDDTKGNLILKNYVKDGTSDPYEMHTVREEGTRHNPTFQYEPATYVDPIPSLNRSMKSMVDSMFMDDYKTFAVESWLQRAINPETGLSYLNADAKAIADSPFHHFFHTEYRPGTPVEVQYALNDSKAKAQRLWGTPSKIQTELHTYAQEMADSLYGKGPASKISPVWMFDRALDGAKAIRAATFDVTIGLFSLPIFLVQQSTYVTIAGIEGIGRAGAATAGALLHQWARLPISGPKTLDLMDSLASKVYVPTISGAIKGEGAFARFLPGQWKEARELLLKTGFHLTSSDTALTNNPLSVNVRRSGTQQVLDWGRVPFNEGDRNARLGAWYASYLRFRAKNPTGRVNDLDLAEILDHADLLAGNMSAASKSTLQQGPGAFATQFLGYTMRMAELATGKRLTAVERARLYTTYWGAFGVGGAGLTGVPVGDYIRSLAIDNGYEEKPDNWSTWAIEGPASMLVELITGERYNIGQRFGAPGFDPIRDVLSGDKSMWTIAMGASGNVLSNVWTQSDGLRTAIMSVFKDDGKFFPLSAQDFIEPLKAVASVNAAIRWKHALNTTDWISRKGMVLDTDISPVNAAILSLTGTQTQKAANLQSFFSLGSEIKDDQKKTEDAFLREWRRFSQAVKDKDFANARFYGTRANAILREGNYPVTKYGELAARAERESMKTVTDRAMFNYYLGRDVPETQRAPRQKTYQEKLRNELRNQ